LGVDALVKTIEILIEAARHVDKRILPIRFSEVPGDSSLGLCLAERAATPGSWITQGPDTPCPRLQLNSMSDLRRVLRKKSVVRHDRQLGKLGCVSVEHMTDPIAIHAELPFFFDQHVRRWEATRYPSLFTNESNREFYKRLVAELAPCGSVIFSVLRVDGAPAAYHFGLRSRDELIWYKPSFEPRLSRYSPGEVLLSRLIKFAWEEGLRALDFSRGSEAFKSRFSNECSYNASYVLHGSWLAYQHAASMALGRSFARVMRGAYRKRSARL
jgi:CelD/BcsL family acetyltransferase involved in cellulose biosynthesis